MRVVVDSDIWGFDSLFNALGEVIPLPGRAINSASVRSADALIVRSVTCVDEALLGGSSVCFVGTATSGIDHVDHDCLRRRGIVLAAAPGCNARPAAEYVVSCLFEWRRRTGRPLNRSVLGVIGRGRIGRGVADWGAALGMRVLAADPPLERAGQLGLCPIEQLLAESDIITLHVPLTQDGSDATQGLIDARRLDQMKPGAWLINAARGGVVVDADLIAAIDAKRLGGAILDVWCGEPVVSQDLLRVATLMTPHMAGYSAGAHRRAAERIAAVLSNWIGGRVVEPDEMSGSTLSASHLPIGVNPLNEADVSVVESLVRQVCDISTIDSEYRRRLKHVSPVEAFDRIRGECRARAELTDMELGGQFMTTAVRALLRAWTP